MCRSIVGATPGVKHADRLGQSKLEYSIPQTIASCAFPKHPVTRGVSRRSHNVLFDQKGLPLFGCGPPCFNADGVASKTSRVGCRLLLPQRAFQSAPRTSTLRF